MNTLRIKRFRFLAVAALSLIVSFTLVNCKGGGGGGTEIGVTPDTTPPVVSSTSPANNDSGVAINASATAVFSEGMDPATINGTTFTLSGVTGTVTYNAASKIATFAPSSSLASSTTYTATVTTGVKDIAGNAMAAQYVWSFTTGTAADTTAPEVVSTSPTGNATGVSASAAITAVFSEALDVATVNGTTFTVSGGVTGTVSYDAASRTATFTPSSNLTGSTTYTATITTGVTDVAGNALATGYAWSFTTVVPSSGVRILYQRYGGIISMYEDNTGVASLGTGNLLGVSPSGKVLYSWGSGFTQLVSVNPDGTGAANVASYATGHGFMGFSSNGRVVYGASGDLFAVNSDGTGTVTLANSSDDELGAIMGPNGRVVYLQDTGTGDQYVRSVKDDGTGNIVLDGTAGGKILHLVSATGQLYYDRLDAWYNGSAYVINTDGSGFGTIAATPGYTEGFSRLAPDGTVIVEGCQLPGCNSDLVTVGGGTMIDLGSSGSVMGVTSDNKVIAWRYSSLQFDVIALPTSGGVVGLAADPSVSEVFNAICPDNRVVYSKSTGTNSSGLFSVKSDGTGAVALANSSAGLTFLGVTSTSRVVYGTGSGLLNAIYSINSDGTDNRTLNLSSNGMSYRGVSSSGKVLYLDYTAGGVDSDLYIVGHDGGTPINLTGNPSSVNTFFLRSVP